MAAVEVPPMLDMTVAVQGLVNMFLNMDGKSREMFIKLLVVKMEEEEVDLILQVVDMRNLSPNDLNNLSVEKDEIKIKQEPILDSNFAHNYETESNNEQNAEGGKIYISTVNADELNIDSKILSNEPNNFNLNNHTVKSEFKCSYCDESFFNKTDLLKHKTTHPEYNEEKTFLCDLCPKSFRVSAHLKRHKNVHDGIKPFFCDICPKSFYTNQDLKRHTNMHDGIKPFLCDQCPHTSSQQGSLNEHKKLHTGGPFLCDECPHESLTTSDLKNHKLKCHKENKPKSEDGPNIFICEICSNSYKTNEKLKRHIRDIHTRSKVLNCDQCRYETVNITDLKRHKTIHTDERPFACHICSNTFKTSRLMKRHIEQVHMGKKRNKVQTTGEKNHLCDICSGAFTTSSTLLIHKETIHEGIKKFQCDQCGHKATSRGNLTQHVAAVHEGIKRKYETPECLCQKCGYKTTSKQRLKIHEESVHLGIRHECSQCDHKATSKGNLIQHVEYVHESFQHDCKECDYTTTKKRSFLHHMTGHRKAQELQNQIDSTNSPFEITDCQKL